MDCVNTQKTKNGDVRSAGLDVPLITFYITNLSSRILNGLPMISEAKTNDGIARNQGNIVWSGTSFNFPLQVARDSRKMSLTIINQ